MGRLLLGRAAVLLAVGVGLAVASTPGRGRGADNRWTNVTGNFIWSNTADNWSLIPNYWDNQFVDTAIFGPTGAGVVTVGSPVTVRGLSFTANGYVITGSSNAITLANGGGSDSGVLPGEVRVAGGVTVTVSAPLAGTVGLTKTGAGTLTLGSLSNGYAGGTVVTAGTLVADFGGSALPPGSNVTVAGGARFQVGSGNNASSPHSTLTLNGGVFEMPAAVAANYYVNRLEMTAPGSAINLLDGGSTKSVHLTGPGAGVSVTADGTWTGGSNSLIVNVTSAPVDLAVAPGATLTSSLRLASVFGSPRPGFRVTGGGTLAVTNVTNDAALTVAPATTLRVADVAALGTGALTLDGGIVAYTGPTAATSKGFQATAAGGGTVAVGTAATTLTLDGAVTGGGVLTKAGPGALVLTNPGNRLAGVTVAGGRLDVPADAALGGPGAVVSAGPAGTVRYTAPQATARTFALTGGTLEAPAGGALTLNGAAVGGGFLRAAGPAGGFALAGGATVTGATILPGTAVAQAGPAAFRNVTSGGTLTNPAGQPLLWDGGFLIAAGRLTVGGTVNTTAFESVGAIQVNPGGTVANAGTDLTLGGGSTTVLTSAAGTGNRALVTLGGNQLHLRGGLLVNNGGNFASGGGVRGGPTDGRPAVVVDFGGLAKGPGYYSSVETQNGGVYSPGNSPGLGEVGVFNVNGGGSFLFEINDAAGVAGPDGAATTRGWDKVDVFDRINFAATPGNKFNLPLRTLVPPAGDTPGNADNFDPARAYSFAFAELQAGGTVAGTFDPAAFNINPAEFTNPTNGGTFAVTFDGTRLALTFTPVPEPKAVLAMAAAAGGLTWARRRARRGVG